MNLRDIFEKVDYGSAPESAREAQAWLEAHGRRFVCFLGGAFSKAGEALASRTEVRD